MVEDVGGVYALLKRDIPHLIKVHCMAHRLELAFSAVFAVRKDQGSVARDMET